MLGQETVPAINANSAAHLLRPRDPPVGSLVVKELQRDMLAHAEQQRLAGAGTLRCAGRCDGRSGRAVHAPRCPQGPAAAYRASVLSLPSAQPKHALIGIQGSSSQEGI
jgi:hypothetical protein